MTRSPSRYLVVVGLLAAATAGCAFADGDPWGRLELTLEARLHVSADRIEGAALKTSRDYLVTLEAADLLLDDVVVRQRAAGAAAAFDPADPPEGYSLCHNGHCHADDGRLVSYEDIAAELGGQGAGSGPSVTIESMGELVALPIGATTLGSPTPVPLQACPGGCSFGRGALDSVEVAATELHVRGVVRDRLTGDAARLPPGGRAFDVVIPAPAAVTAPLGGAFDKGEPVGLRLGVTFDVPDSLFDAVDWSAVADGELPALLATELGESASLTVHRQSFD